MGLNPQTIGTSMPNGFAGCYARQPDMIVNTRPAGGSAAIPFGTPLKYSSGAVVAMGASDTADLFVGIAGAEIKSALTYLDQYQGEYAVGEPVSVFQRGCINVYCQHGTPALGQPVYLRITANGSYSSAVVGGLEQSADDDSGKLIELPNCQWAGPADANGIAEMRIMTMVNA